MFPKKNFLRPRATTKFYFSLSLYIIYMILFKLKEVAGFGIFFIFSIIALGIAIRISLFGSTSTGDFKEVARNIMGTGFFPIFGNMDIYSDYLADSHFADSYSRSSCLAQSGATDKDCPYHSGVIFTYIALIFYLIIMNLVFVNLLISAFSYKKMTAFISPNF